MTAPSLVILRVGSGYYLQNLEGQLATWAKDPLVAALFTLPEAEDVVLALFQMFPAVPVAARTWDPVLDSITRTQRFNAEPTDPTMSVVA